MCVFCHERATPGIVVDWQRSRHALMTPEKAMEADPMARRMSAGESMVWVLKPQSSFEMQAPTAGWGAARR